jgi:hypothetical protein
MQESPATLATALDAARQGINQAQEQARQAGGRRALLGVGEGSAGAAGQRQAPQPDLVRDMVQLTQSASAVRANAATVHIVSGVSEEVVNLGRRIDVKA